MDDELPQDGSRGRRRSDAPRVVWAVLPWLIAGACAGWAAASAYLIAEVRDRDARLEAEHVDLTQRLHSIDAHLAEARSLLLEATEADKRAPEPTVHDQTLAPMSGPGISVTVDDSHAEQGTVVHDQDLLVLVNELRAADAEGIAINGIRLTATTATRCTGPTVRVGGTAVGPPFRIEAVGDPGTLEAALRLPGGIVEELSSVGIEVHVVERSDVKLPSAPFAPPRFGEAPEPKADAAPKAGSTP
jgi:uncharacterized protein YlxW (UPF0749 family)